MFGLLQLADGELSGVSGFDATDIEIFGGQLTDFNEVNSTHFSSML